MVEVKGYGAGRVGGCGIKRVGVVGVRGGGSRGRELRGRKW